MAFKKFSSNPEDWKLIYSCGCEIQCKKYGTFAGNKKKLDAGEKLMCMSCVQKGKPQSEEKREKLRNRVWTEEQRKANGERTSARYANMTPEEKEEVSRIQKEAFAKGRANMSEERKLEIKLSMDEALRNLSPERKAEKNKNISEGKKKKFIESGTSFLHLPDTWKLTCAGCETEIKFDNYNNFQNAKSQVKKGKEKFCEECKEKNKKGSEIHKDNWKIECHDEECNVIIEYQNFSAYSRALERIERGEPKYCDECKKGKHPKKNGPKRTCSENPEDWKVKCKFDDCDKILVANSYGAWTGIVKRIRDGNPPMCYSCASKRADRTKQFNNNSGKPNYNKRTIDYITSTLNKEFNTEFWHGESERGEYFLYDSEVKTYYFADAYCPKLNLWIEIDEKYHFVKGSLREDCQKRHQRIKQLIECDIIRLKFIQKNGNIEFIEYHNDLKQITGF